MMHCLFQSYVYFWWVNFQLKTIMIFLATKYRLDFLWVAKYRDDFWCKNIDSIFVSCKISGLFFDTKYQADICDSFMNQTLWSQGAYQLEIISNCSGRSGQLPIQICSVELTDSVNCWLVSNQPLRCINTTGTMTVNTRIFWHSLSCT